VLEAERVALYLGVYVLAAVAGTRATAARWADGLALGIVGVAVFSLAVRFFPDLVALTELERKADEIRLSYPVNYWNALAVLVAMALPLLLRIAVRSRNPLARAAAIAPFPAVASVLYLTSSRGGFLAAAVGALAFTVLSRRPWAAAAALAFGVLGGAAAIAALVSSGGGGAADGATGAGVALTVGLLCLGCGLAFGAATAFVPEGLRVPRPLSWAAAAAVVALAVFAVVASDPGRRFEEFKQPPPAFASEDVLKAHLLSGSGSYRWQVWNAAVDQYREAPVRGQGAGSFEAWWLQHPSFRQVMRDAHSLYLETLGELGVVGLALLVAAFGAALASAVRRPRVPGDRTLVAALVGVVAAFAAAAAIDWMWELPAVALVAFAALGLHARTDAALPRRSVRVATVVAVLGAAALGLTAIHGITLLAHLQLRSSQEAAAENRTDEAVDGARRARALAPWAVSPHLQLALVAEQAGRLESARTSIRAATDRDADDWRLWLVTARIETKLGSVEAAREALRTARRLNPRSGLLVEN
jgi:tetratricopeptide (TPR) repeat protein